MDTMRLLCPGIVGTPFALLTSSVLKRSVFITLCTLPVFVASFYILNVH